MIRTIIKRDGSKVDFDLEKISIAIGKTGMLSKEDIKLVSLEILKKLEGDVRTAIRIEDVQDIVEGTLLELGCDSAFQEYVTYRRKRAISRDKIGIANTKLLKDIESIPGTANSADIKRENANVDGDTPMGTMLQFGSAISKEYAESYLLKPTAKNLHKNGDIHIHDLDFYPMGTTTCLQIDLEKLFKGGFSTGHGYLREPQSIGAYASLAAIAVQANQNDQHGGQSIPMFDYYMAPGVLKTFKKNFKKIRDDFNSLDINYQIDEETISKISDEDINNITSIDEFLGLTKYPLDNKLTDIAMVRTVQDTYQAMEGFIHNMNTMHSRAGAQVPFSSINFGTDKSIEGRMVTEQYLLALEAGLGNGETPIFPISIFKVKEGLNYGVGDYNYDLFELACKVSAKRMFPNFAFIDAPHNIVSYDHRNPKTEVAYMG